VGAAVVGAADVGVGGVGAADVGAADVGIGGGVVAGVANLVGAGAVGIARAIGELGRAPLREATTPADSPITTIRLANAMAAPWARPRRRPDSAPPSRATPARTSREVVAHAAATARADLRDAATASRAPRRLAATTG
jgi:hypothetical protein